MSRPPEPASWTDDLDAQGVEAHAGELLRAVRAAPVPSGLMVAELARKVASHQARRRSTRRTRVVAIALVIIAAQALAAVAVKNGWLAIPSFVRQRAPTRPVREPEDYRARRPAVVPTPPPRPLEADDPPWRPRPKDRPRGR